MASTSLLDLPEELYGRVYERIDCSDSKRAFRHTHSSIYRSWSINAHLTSVSVSGTSDFVPCIAAFPRCATLKRLELRDCGDLEECLSRVTLPDHQSRAVMKHLSSVYLLRLEVCTISRDSGALLSCCFPKLRHGCESASLELVKCEMSTLGIGSCTEMLKLQDLAVLKCIGVSGNELVGQLAHATTLKSLEVALCAPLCGPFEPCDVMPLTPLSQLVVLKLWRLKPLHLGTVLAALPSLEVLGVELDELEEVEPLASNTVRQLQVRRVSRRSRPIEASEFPFLDFFVFSGLDFSSSEEDEEDEENAEDALELVVRMVSWLSLLPLKAESFKRSVDYWPIFLHEVNCFWLEDLPDMDSDQSAACWLQALSPLRAAFSAVGALFVDKFNFSPSLFHVFTELFPGVEVLMLQGELQVSSLSQCLLSCIRGMPHMHKVVVDLLDGIGDVSDLMAPLIEARETRQCFELHVLVDVDVPESVCASLKAVADQWSACTRLLARGPLVTMAVHQYDMHDDD